MERSNALDPRCQEVVDLETIQIYTGGILNIAKLLECSFITEANSHADSTTMPTDFEENVKGLVLSSDGQVKIVADAPLKLPSLKFLVLHIILDLNVPKDFFSMLHSLEMPVTSKVHFANDVPQLPSSIKFLVLVLVKPPYDLTKFNNLEKFDYVSSGLMEFPSIPSAAPLRELNLQNNPLTKLTLPDIAQYCLLNVANLEDTNIQNSSEAAYCELAAWFRSHKIKYSITSWENFDMSKCPPTVPENAEAVSRYKSCLRGNFWLNYVVLIAAGIVVCLALIGAVSYFWLRRKNGGN